MIFFLWPDKRTRKKNNMEIDLAEKFATLDSEFAYLQGQCSVYEMISSSNKEFCVLIVGIGSKLLGGFEKVKAKSQQVREAISKMPESEKKRNVTKNIDDIDKLIDKRHKAVSEKFNLVLINNFCSPA